MGGSQQPVLTAHVVLQDGRVDAEQVRRTLAEALEEQFNVDLTIRAGALRLCVFPL